jgi:hypothetical protein
MTTALDAFWAKVDTSAGPAGCWPWTGCTAYGYGMFRGKSAHILAYEVTVGPVPGHLVLDHTCHNQDPTCAGGPACRHRRCCNPAHLDPCTQRENILRSPLTMPHVNRAKTRCPAGHEYSEANTYRRASGRRECRICRYERQVTTRQLARAAA